MASAAGVTAYAARIGAAVDSDSVCCRAQAYIKDHVEGYQPKAEDLAYPAKLEALASKAAAAAAAASAESAAEGEITEASNGDSHEEEEVRACCGARYSIVGCAEV